MSLPVAQQRILDGIEDGLRAHDSRLASMFATFTRLTRQEEMPWFEQLRPRRRKGGSARRRGSRPRSGLRYVAFLPVVLVAVLSAVVIGLLVSSSHNNQCSRGSSIGLGTALPHVNTCPAHGSQSGRG
jgi:hypothetical protein